MRLFARAVSPLHEFLVDYSSAFELMNQLSFSAFAYYQNLNIGVSFILFFVIKEAERNRQFDT